MVPTFEYTTPHLYMETARERLRVGMLALIMISYIATSAMSVAIPDTTRDIYAAYEISRGRWLPLEGPVFGGAIHLGPIWYYLLAIPFVFVHSWLALTIFVSAMAALKFVFAYLCGAQLVDRDFALIWVSCLAFPEWTTLEQITLFTPNITEATVLAVLFFNISLWRRPSLVIAFVLGLACALAVHSHPTTAVALPLSLASVLLASSRPVRLTNASFFLGGLALLFVPYAASQILSGGSDFETAGKYMSGNLSVLQLFNVPAILYAALVVGPLQIGSYLLHLSIAQLWIYRLFLVALGFVSLVGVIRGLFARSHRPLLIGLAIVICGLSIEIAFLRATTPAYFVYVLMPFLSALLALGLWHVGRMLQLRYLSFGIAALALAGELLLASCRLSAVQDGIGTLPDFSDILTSTKRAPYTDIWFPAYAHDVNGDFLCARGGRTSLHGPLAYLADRNLNVDSMIRCDRTPSLELSGQTPRDRLHLIGLPRAFWSVLNRAPTCWLGPLGITQTAQVVWPPTSIPQMSPRTYYPRPFFSGPSVTKTVTFGALPSEAVVITNVVFGYTAWEIESVEANGSKVEPTLKTEMSRLYVFQALPTLTTVRWRIIYTTPDPGKVDIATVLTSRPGAQDVSSCNSETAWQLSMNGTWHSS
jgi:hypothetical protein